MNEKARELKVRIRSKVGAGGAGDEVAESARDHKKEISRMIGFLKYRASPNFKSQAAREEAAFALEAS